MATTHGQLETETYITKIPTPAETKESSRQEVGLAVQSTTPSLDGNINSAELINRISDLVDGFTRLSRNGHLLPVMNDDFDEWTIFDCARAILSLTATHR